MVAVPAWVNGYVGIPYVELGRDLTGWDCWGCVATIHKEQFGIDIGSYEGVGCIYSTEGPCSPSLNQSFVAEFIDRQRSLLWDDILLGQEAPGDLVMLKAFGATIHVGIVCTPGVMLHCSHGTDTCLDRYTSGRWSRRVDRLIRYRRGDSVSQAS